MKATQASLFDRFGTKSQKREYAKRVTHGGERSKGKRKLRRPLATKKWIHLILKSDKAFGQHSMLSQKNASYVDRIVIEKARKFRIELNDFVNMGNHIHFQIRLKRREDFQNFLRSISSLIARFVTGAKKGKAFGRFWQALAFTRVIHTGLEIMGVEGYLLGNKIEKRHGREAREVYLRAFNRWLMGFKVARTH